MYLLRFYLKLWCLCFILKTRKCSVISDSLIFQLIFIPYILPHDHSTLIRNEVLILLSSTIVPREHTDLLQSVLDLIKKK